jgi:hypothetical protein
VAAAFERALTALREAHTVEVTALKGQLGATEEAVKQARAQAQAAQDTADELRRADEARKARGRLRRAWDGWRGR